MRRTSTFNLLTELKSCSSSKNLARGKSIHEAVIQSGDVSDPCVANTLIDMYGKCGSLLDARKVFDNMHIQTVVSWTALISGYADNGEGEIALDLFSRMEHEGYPPNDRSFVVAVKACTDVAAKEDGLTATQRGKALHMLAATCCCASNIYLESTLVDMYAKCGSMENAREVFDRMRFHDVVSWTAIVLGYADNGENEMALEMFARLKCEGCLPNARSFVAALKACNGLEVNQAPLDRGKAMHLLASSNDCDSDIYVENTLVDLYAKFGTIEEARDVFNRMQWRDVVSWSSLIMGYAENGKGELALELFSNMAREGYRPNGRTFVSALKACTDLAESEELNECKSSGRLHSFCYDSNLYALSTLLDMYAKYGNSEDAQLVFDKMQQHDVVSWTALILGYVENREGETALDMFCRIRRDGCAPDTITFASALKACSDIAASADFCRLSTKQRGKVIHFFASVSGCGSNIYVENTLLDMYSKFRNMKDARSVFERMQYRDHITWTTLILGYVESGDFESALSLFSSMRLGDCVPTARTFVAALKACSMLAMISEDGKVESLERGKQIHLLADISGCTSSVFVENTLMDMYAKCGNMDDALSVFERMKTRTTVSWNVIISGYADNGEGAVVLELFTRMKHEAWEPDVITFVPVLRACGMLGALEFGKAAHVEMRSRGFLHDGVLLNCLLDFYTKCGDLSEAKQVFDLHPTKDIVTWHVLMAGYSRHGDMESVFSLFEMLKCTSLELNRITFVCLLTACSRAGVVDKGKEHFQTMNSKYGIVPDSEHFGCMLDMLGRANKLDEAMIFLRSMPLTPNAVTWMTVLGACRKWKNVKLGRLAFDSVKSLDGLNSGSYILMANIYGSRGMWDDQAIVHASRLKLKVWKTRAQSWWTSRAGEVHKFSIGDKSHPHFEQVLDKLNEIVQRLKEHGYIADLSCVTQNISDTEKEGALCGHSERLAIACALMFSEPGETIRIIKNLRICDDCHTATALISRLEQRTILCRDTIRYHVFKDGTCSCGDFW